MDFGIHWGSGYGTPMDAKVEPVIKFAKVYNQFSLVIKIRFLETLVDSEFTDNKPLIL